MRQFSHRGSTVDNGDKRNPQLHVAAIGRSRSPVAPRRLDMVLPRDLAVRISTAQPLQTFRLPIDAARRKAREVIDESPRNGATSTVENWRQLPDGRIEFAVRYFNTVD
jgi:hypothetical protein